MRQYPALKPHKSSTNGTNQARSAESANRACKYRRSFAISAAFLHVETRTLPLTKGSLPARNAWGFGWGRGFASDRLGGDADPAQGQDNQKVAKGDERLGHDIPQTPSLFMRQSMARFKRQATNAARLQLDRRRGSDYA
jgi:hypothetical protein